MLEIDHFIRHLNSEQNQIYQFFNQNVGRPTHFSMCIMALLTSNYFRRHYKR